MQRAVFVFIPEKRRISIMGHKAQIDKTRSADFSLDSKSCLHRLPSTAAAAALAIAWYLESHAFIPTAAAAQKQMLAELLDRICI